MATHASVLAWRTPRLGSLVGCHLWGHTESDTTEVTQQQQQQQYSIVYMHHSLFIPLSVDGHLGCFHVLAIVNSAARNNGIHVFPKKLYFSFGFLRVYA